MKRQARCWICGALFEAERGSLPKGARFTCDDCAQDGLRPTEGPPGRAALARVLYERHGVPYLDLANAAIEENVLRLVSEDFARHHSLIPVMLKLETESAPAPAPKAKKEKTDKISKKATAKTPAPIPEPAPVTGTKTSRERPVALVIAMSDPANRFAIEAIRRRIGLPVQTVVSTWAEIAEAIGDHYLKIALADEPAPE